MEKPIYTLQLILTKQCNLNCSYCYVLQQDEVMGLETAKSAIRLAVEKADMLNAGLIISFMGGEPLTAFERMREICEWTWKTYDNKQIVFRSPTNGTILTEEMSTWFRSHKDSIVLALSYDGSLCQNENRNLSDTYINQQFFFELWPFQPWKMTISENNVSNLAKNMISMQESGILFEANCACGEPAWSKEHVMEFGHQMFLLADYYLNHPEKPLCNLLTIDFMSVFFDRTPMHRRCGLGYQYTTIDCDGDEYSCHMFSPLSLTKENAVLAKAYDFENLIDFTVSECRECILNQTCPKCYGMAFKCTGTPFQSDPNLCATFKQQVRAACSYQIKYQYGKKDLDEIDDRNLAAVKKIISAMDFVF